MTAAWAAWRDHAAQFPGSDAVLLALGLDRGRLAELEGFPDERCSAFADEHLARRRCLLEPRRDVHGVAGRERASFAGPPDHDVPGVHPNPQREAVAEEALQALEHPQRRLQCPLRVVLLGGRRAEDRDDGVADELLHRPAAERDLGFHGVVELLQEISRVLGIEFVAERGGADEIGEQKRRQLPLHCTRITRASRTGLKSCLSRRAPLP